MAQDIAAFHRHVAEELAAHYAASQRAPEGWREIAAWHWEQAGAFAEANEAAPEGAEGRVAQARNNREATARAHLAIGRMQRELAQLTIAEAALQQARALAERDELGELEAEVRLHIAKVHQLQG